MRRRRAFTLIEFLAAVAIVVVLAAVSFFGYTRFFRKTVSTEALISVHKIREAEKILKAETGAFIAANNTTELNALLDLGIAPRYYEYRVCNVTDDDFIVIAQRIGADIESGSAGTDLDMIVMSGGGVAVTAPQTGGAAGAGGTGISVTPSGQPGGAGGGGAAPGAGPTAGGGSGGGSSGGGSSGGGSSGGGSSGGGSSGGGSSGGGEGGGGGISAEAAEAVLPIAELLSLLQGSANGAYFYNLIQTQNVSIEYADMGDGYGGVYFPTWWKDMYQCVLVTDCEVNTIYLNSRLAVTYGWPAEAVAAILVHESMHADYDHNTDPHVLETTARLGVTSAELNWTWDSERGEDILEDSQDQEFVAFRQMVLLWREVKGSLANGDMDYLQALYELDEATGVYLYEEVVSRYGGYAPYDKL